MKNLEREFIFFNNKLEELKKDYLNKYIVIKGEKILGVYDDFDEAMEKTKKTEEIGTFLIQKVEENPNAYTIYFNHNVQIYG